MAAWLATLATVGRRNRGLRVVHIEADETKIAFLDLVLAKPHESTRQRGSLQFLSSLNYDFCNQYRRNRR